MSGTGKSDKPGILVVRLGAMGDIVHTLPAVTALSQNHPQSHLTWLVEPRWLPLLEGNPFVDRIVVLRRQSLGGLMETRAELRQRRYDCAFDFQGLMKSALCAWSAGPREIRGFNASQVRERAASWFYSQTTLSRFAHVVDRNMDLAGAPSAQRVFPLPDGQPEGDLPGDFVLASPLAGWQSKQWPLEHYEKLGARLKQDLGITLLLNGPPDSRLPHRSGIPGLIFATRRALAVVGVDSGPLHLAAALGKPGVAIFGPTDPARNGPYGASIRVLRAPTADTTYKRGAEIDASMREVTPDQVFESLLAGCLAR
jgi:heptosyltransferase-1